MKFLNCLISVWNGSSQQKLFYNVFCYIIQYSLTLISPKVIHHLGGQAHNIAVELERVKASNEQAVPKKALPSFHNQPRIDHVWDENMREGYIKLFRTLYTLEIEPTSVPSTVNQPRIDHVCDKNMKEGYIKLFRTAYTLEIEPTIVSNIKINQGFPYWRRAWQLAENFFVPLHQEMPTPFHPQYTSHQIFSLEKTWLVKINPHHIPTTQ